MQQHSIRSVADSNVYPYSKLANEIGFNESLMLLQIAHWIETEGQLVDGQWRILQSIRSMQSRAFSFWSIGTVNRVILKLVECGYVSETINRSDKSRWLSLNFSSLENLPSITKVDLTTQNVTSIKLDKMNAIQNGTSKVLNTFQNETSTMTQNETSEVGFEVVLQNETPLNELDPVDSNQTLLDSFPLRESDSFNAFNNNIYIKQEKESNTQSVKESKLPSQLESESPQQKLTVQELVKDVKTKPAKSTKSRAKSKTAKTDSPAGEPAQSELKVVPVPAKPKLEDYQDYVKIVSKAFNLAPGPMVGKWINFFRGTITDKKGDYLYYQPTTPLHKDEIAGLFFWYWAHPRFGGRKGLPQEDRYLPRTVSLVAQRIDEFRADPKYDQWLENGHQGLERLLAGKPIETQSPLVIPPNKLREHYRIEKEQSARPETPIDEDLERRVKAFLSANTPSSALPTIPKVTILPQEQEQKEALSL